VVVENCRAAHAVHVAQQTGGVDTEAQRAAFIHYHALFEQLLKTETQQNNTDTSTEANP
jgi:hypothetical protein